MTILTDSQREYVLISVQRAGDFAQAHWPSGEEKRPFQIEEKEDGSPVTTVDKAVNDFLVNELSRMFPDDGFYTEEAPPSDNLHTADAVWVIDPIDGTAHFVKGEKEYGVLIARVVNGKAVFGAAYFPAYEVFLWAEEGKGAFSNDQPLKVSQSESLLPERVYVRNGKLSNASYKYPEELGTAHGFFYLCAGKVDGLVGYITQHQEWDIGPWVPIVQESGGMITDQLGQEITFHFARPTYTALVASHRSIHESILSLVKR